MSDQTFNWGIIGPGKIAHKFAKDLKAISHARLHAVASRSLDRALDFANEYGASHAYGSYQELMNCPDLHAVYIATPNSGHLVHALLCLENKIPVLCEKPLAMNFRQAKTMVDCARQNETFLMEAIWTRFLPITKRALDIVKSGEIGRVEAIKADFCIPAPFNPEGRLFNPALGGGALLDLGIYTLFIAQLFLGKPTDITATSQLGTTGVDEDTGILLRYAGGQMAHLHTSLRYESKTEAFIYGDKGVINIQSRFHEARTLNYWLRGQRPEFSTLDRDTFGYNYEAIEVMACVRAGKTESEDLPLQFSLDLMETMDAIRQQIGLTYEVD